MVNTSLISALRAQKVVETFDFRRNWWRIMPLLSRRDVKAAASIVFKDYPGCNENTPPYLVSDDGTSPRFEPYSLGYYRPIGGCHYMAPFCLTLGRILYPQYTWAILTSDLHSVAVGLEHDRAAIVFDITWFDFRTGRESVQNATADPATIVYSADELIRYWRFSQLSMTDWRGIKVSLSRRIAALNGTFLAMPPIVG